MIKFKSLNQSSQFLKILKKKKFHTKYFTIYFDKNSNKDILDFFGQYATLSLGYNHPIYENKAYHDDIKRRTVDVVRLLEDLNETVRRRDIYLAAERRRLTQLASAIAVGESFGLGLGSLNSLPVSDDNSVDEKRSENVSGNPIAVLRIRGQSTKYNQGLFGAVSAALERTPNAKFTLVAVSSSAGNASEKAERAANAREKAGRVINSLISMGMPANRLSVTELALAEVEDTEVRVYAD